MKFLANALMILLAAYGAYRLYETYAPPAWPHVETAGVDRPSFPANSSDAEGSEGRDGSTSSTNASAQTREQKETRRIVCPTCDGEGRLTYADRRAANHTYPCPICNGRGVRELRVREGQHICPDCKGMGATERREVRKGIGGYVVKEPDRGGATYGHVSGESRRRAQTGGYIVRSSRCLRCNLSGVVGSEKTRPPGATPGVQTPDSYR